MWSSVEISNQFFFFFFQLIIIQQQTKKPNFIQSHHQEDQSQLLLVCLTGKERKENRSWKRGRLTVENRDDDDDAVWHVQTNRLLMNQILKSPWSWRRMRRDDILSLCCEMMTQRWAIHVGGAAAAWAAGRESCYPTQSLPSPGKKQNKNKKIKIKQKQKQKWRGRNSIFDRHGGRCALDV